VFLGFRRGVPVGKHVLSDRFNEALARIGVTETLRRNRQLMFHSTRHKFNSFMRGRIDSGKLFRIIGHRQESTNITYTHILPRDLEEVRMVQEEILSVAFGTHPGGMTSHCRSGNTTWPPPNTGELLL